MFLKYRPKRLIKIQSGDNDKPFQDFRYLPLNENKVFNSFEKKNVPNLNQKLINYSSKKADEFYDENNLKLKKYEFRSIYMLKKKKNIHNFNKLKMKTNLITNNKIGVYNEITDKILKLMNSQKMFFFKNLYEKDENTNTDINNTNITNKVPSTNNSINLSKSNIIKNNVINNNNIENIIKKEILLSCEYNTLINKLFSFLLDEINCGKTENSKLLHKNHEEEIIINSKTKSIKELNEYLNRYDVDNKINYYKHKNMA